MTAKIQTAPATAFAPLSGTAGLTEAKKQIGAAIDSGLRSLISGAGNGQVKYRVEPHGDGEFRVVVTKVRHPKPTLAKAKAPRVRTRPAETDLETALEAAQQRGAVLIAKILAGDDMASADDFAALLGITRQSLHGKLDKHQVLGLEGAKRGVRFPTWQIGADGKPFPALPALHEALGNPWAVYRFLKQFHPELDCTGLEALQRGRDDAALDVARNLDQSFA